MDVSRTLCEFKAAITLCEVNFRTIQVWQNLFVTRVTAAVAIGSYCKLTIAQVHSQDNIIKLDYEVS